MPEPRAALPYDDDAERVEIQPATLGEPVDPPGHVRTVYGTITGLHDAERRPVVAAWLRSRDQRAQVARAAVGYGAHAAAFHVTRSPKYAAKVLLWAPVGVFTTVWRLIRWAWDLESWSTRQNAATRNDVEDYLRLSQQRDRRHGARVRVLIFGLVAACVAVAFFVAYTPRAAQWAAGVVLLVACAWIGRPADKPITDRVTVGAAFTRLTAEMVRAALVSLGIARLKEAGDVTFATEIHRDGPGWLARVNLPYGVEAIEVIERRRRVSSALRLPVDQVWPEAGPDHAGQLDLWVAARPVSAMPPPRWALASDTASASVFTGYPIGFDERQRPVSFTPFQRNLLIGGQPGSGKTYAARAVVLGALLDPTAEVWLAAFKPAEDFFDVSNWCTRYECGLDEATMAAAEGMVMAGLAEVRRRQEVLGKLKRAGKITEGRTSPELAAAGLGLHPLFLVFDEVHELFLASKEAGEAMARLIKQGRSAGVIVVLVTQVAGRDSVPPEITRVVSSRWCLSVLDQVANDQIMGTGAYKRGQTGTVYRPGVDAGWGVTSGIADGYAGAARAYFPTDRDLATVLRRIATVRSAGTFATETEDGVRIDVLADVRRVFYAGEVFAAWKTLAARLAEQMPDRYAGITQDAVSALVRGADIQIPSIDGKERGSRRTLKGLRLDHLTQALDRRQIGGSR